VGNVNKTMYKQNGNIYKGIKRYPPQKNSGVEKYKR
jgi:hypothetical protein